MTAWILLVLFILFMGVLIWGAPKLRQRPPTLAESMDHMTVQFHELSRVIGEQVTPIFQNMTVAMQGLVEALQKEDE